MGTRAQKIMSMLKLKTTENSSVSDQKQESPPPQSTLSPPVTVNLETSLTSSFIKNTGVQQEPELLDIMNLEFIDHNVNFVVDHNGVLSYVDPEYNANNDSQSLVSHLDDTPTLWSDIETVNNSDTNDQNENLLLQKTPDELVEGEGPQNNDLDIEEYGDLLFQKNQDELVEQEETQNNDASDIEEHGDLLLQEKQDELVEGEGSQNNEASDIEEYGDMNEGRKRRHRPSQSEWKKNKNKKLRMEGKEYLGYTKPKGQVMKQNQVRETRSLRPACASERCKKSKQRMCEKLTEEERKCIFRKFWSELNWDQRKIYAISHVNRVPTQRKTTLNDSRRGETLTYSLTFNDCKYPVCRTTFLNTIGIGSFTVQSWTKKGNHAMLMNKNCENLNRVKNSPHAENIAYLKDFLRQLPKLPSHYNRANSSKLYLEPIFKSLKQLYDLYLEHCKKADKHTVSTKTFYNQFNESNLALYVPKKDQCDICVAHKVGNLSDDKYAEHIKRKDRARTEKATDKDLAQSGQCIVLTMDLQAVKVCPVVQASSIFFKTKLSCHNFTIYDVVSHHSTCYWFTECDCDLVASAFTSCIIDYLEKHCTAKNLPIIIYSDGCTYQNRNNVLSNALLTYALKNKIPVFQKYLERGHTQMECDSVHSCIERKLKNRDINLPSDYISASKEARTKPFPYEVVKLGFDFFKDYSHNSVLRYTTIRPGRKPNEPTVTDLRALRYNLEGSIDYKLTFDDEWKPLPSRQKKIPNETPKYPPSNKAKIPIKKTKFTHLQELKKVIPDDCHTFYDLLPYKDNN